MPTYDDAFDDPWEHIRLLSDSGRNAAYVELLRRHVKGRTVLEVGCGTGVLACVAARMGATRVLAIEPSQQVHAARELVRTNGLEDIVEVRHGVIADFDPEPMDVVFSELLNAVPFMEGVLEVSRTASAWVAPGGLLAPRRLEIHVALVRDCDSALDRRLALEELDQLGHDYDLDFGSVREALRDPGGYAYLSPGPHLASAPATIYASALRDPDEPAASVVHVEVERACDVGGVAIWFKATLDEGLTLDNHPDSPGHWGVQVITWPIQVAVKPGPFALRVVPDEDGFDVVPA